MSKSPPEQSKMAFKLTWMIWIFSFIGWSESYYLDFSIQLSWFWPVVGEVVYGNRTYLWNIVFHCANGLVQYGVIPHGKAKFYWLYIQDFDFYLFLIEISFIQILFNLILLVLSLKWNFWILFYWTSGYLIGLNLCASVVNGLYSPSEFFCFVLLLNCPWYA